MDNTDNKDNKDTEQQPTPTDEQMPESSGQIHAHDLEPKRSRFANRRGVIGIVAVVILTAVAVGGMLISTSGDDESAEQQNQTADNEEAGTMELAAAIGLVEGTVQLSTDGANWEDASGGETVRPTNYVRTQADSRAVILIDDGSAVRLAENTQAQLAVSDSDAVEIALSSGQVYSRVVESQSRVFAVVTPSERFEAQGTAYRTVAAEFDTVEVYQSKVKVDSDATTVDEGNKYDTRSKETSDIDLAALEQDDFVQWNKQQDSQSDNFKDKLGVLNPTDDTTGQTDSGSGQTPETAESIELTGNAVADGVQLNWVVRGASAADGYKIVRDAADSNPTYGVHTSVFVSKQTTLAHTLDLTDGKSYFFRVCLYRDGVCRSYSNSVNITAPLVELEAVESGPVSLSINNDVLVWTFGGTAPHGFKVVLATTENPTYPANSIQYVSPGTTSTQLPSKPAATYYVRVCKYTASSDISGGCTNYSNQVEYTTN